MLSCLLRIYMFVRKFLLKCKVGNIGQYTLSILTELKIKINNFCGIIIVYKNVCDANMHIYIYGHTVAQLIEAL